MKKNLTLAAAIMACCFLFSACKEAPHQQEEVSYAVITLKPVNRQLSSSYPATIQGRQDIAIYPQVSGTISRVCVKEGEHVRKGQSLFIIDQIPYKAALQMAEANVEAASASVATAQLVYDSKQTLYNGKVISEFDLLTAKNQLLTAKAQLLQAQAQEVTARNNFNYTTVQSPADGVVGTLPFREGTLVAPSIPQPLTIVSDNSEMYIYFSITQNNFLDLTSTYGSMTEVLASLPRVQLALSNNTIYPEEGFIETISGVIDATTGSVSMRAVFPNKGGILHSGASGSIILPNTMNNCLTIPIVATYELQDKVFAYKVVNGIATSTQLTVIPTNDGKEYIVSSGLNTDDVVVVEGVGMLREGTSITIKN
ncbi:efflux RND transporter periplasmic adaptor subunit [Bacteroides sp. 214]|uniref:efflux RND transporter periplasmic adaptor subunit n=1 Tax=Bacteroides sp. 214 TaxID=2302935 RepID=UPI0013D14204|nr:efflux RND transporter periplasmic adaptor subunit [Bacteroides sp. 214]NDW12844.1 efflux RND transporter periplasmic adaptor subunit [Bacteroides sp. 214]